MSAHATLSRISDLSIKTDKKDTRPDRGGSSSGKDIAMEVTLKVEGMMCPKCEARAKKALETVPGVDHAETSHVSGTAVVTGENLDTTVLKAAVESAGYQIVN